MKAVWIYLIHDHDSGLTKIGYANDPRKRLKVITKQEPKLPRPFNFTLVCAWESVAETERKLHQHFASKRSRGEWFDLSNDDIDEIRQMLRTAKRYEIGTSIDDEEFSLLLEEIEPMTELADFIDFLQEGLDENI